jgi:hypothetical protein
MRAVEEYTPSLPPSPPQLAWTYALAGWLSMMMCW